MHSFIVSTIALAGKVFQQPTISEILHHIKDAAQYTQNIQRDISVIKNLVGLSTVPLRSQIQRTQSRSGVLGAGGGASQRPSHRTSANTAKPACYQAVMLLDWTGFGFLKDLDWIGLIGNQLLEVLAPTVRPQKRKACSQWRWLGK